MSLLLVKFGLRRKGAKIVGGKEGLKDRRKQEEEEEE
jgi:hypothetical protein